MGIAFLSIDSKPMGIPKPTQDGFPSMQQVVNHDGVKGMEPVQVHQIWLELRQASVQTLAASVHKGKVADGPQRLSAPPGAALGYRPRDVYPDRGAVR